MISPQRLRVFVRPRYVFPFRVVPPTAHRAFSRETEVLVPGVPCVCRLLRVRGLAAFKCVVHAASAVFGDGDETKRSFYERFLFSRSVRRGDRSIPLIHEEVSRPRASQRVTDSSCENREPGLQVRLDDTGGGGRHGLAGAVARHLARRFCFRFCFWTRRRRDDRFYFPRSSRRVHRRVPSAQREINSPRLYRVRGFGAEGRAFVG
jgi:hypothetical protein